MAYRSSLFLKVAPFVMGATFVVFIVCIIFLLGAAFEIGDENEGIPEEKVGAIHSALQQQTAPGDSTEVLLSDDGIALEDVYDMLLADAEHRAEFVMQGTTLLVGFLTVLFGVFLGIGGVLVYNNSKEMDKARKEMEKDMKENFTQMQTGIDKMEKQMRAGVDKMEKRMKSRFARISKESDEEQEIFREKINKEGEKMERIRKTLELYQRVYNSIYADLFDRLQGFLHQVDDGKLESLDDGNGIKARITLMDALPYLLHEDESERRHAITLLIGALSSGSDLAREVLEETALTEESPRLKPIIIKALEKYPKTAIPGN